jgi:hypothetical protein
VCDDQPGMSNKNSADRRLKFDQVRPDLKIRNGTYYRLRVPGESIVSPDDMPLIEEDPQTVSSKSGQTVYFEYTLI